LSICWSCFDWDAFSTLITGLAAVSAALFVGLKQSKISGELKNLQAQQVKDDLKLRKQTLRLELLERRSDSIQKMREISNTFLIEGSISREQWFELRTVLHQAQLLYPDNIVVDIEKALTASMKSQHYAQRAENYFQKQKDDEGQKQLTKQFEADDELFSVMPNLLDRMIAESRVFDWLDE
jgi:hypothetical protein